MRKTRPYVAGPYTSAPDANTDIAIAVGNVLLDAGFCPFVPHLSHFWEQRHPQDYERWLELDLAFLRECDFLVRIPGESSGADSEVECCHAWGIPVEDVPTGMTSEQAQAWVAGLVAKYGLEQPVHEVPDGATPLTAPTIPVPVQQALARIAEIFGKKNADYATEESWRSNFEDVARQLDISDRDACETLIAVKQARLRALRTNGRLPANESVDDTVLDRAVYGVISLAMLIEDGERG